MVNIFLPNKIMITTNPNVSYFGSFNFDLKSTLLHVFENSSETIIVGALFRNFKNPPGTKLRPEKDYNSYF